MIDNGGKRNLGRLPFLAGVFWLVFSFASFLSGGFAVSGKVDNGRYYLGQGGTYTHVSRGMYFGSAIFTAALAVLLPSLICTTAWHMWKDVPSKSKSQRIASLVPVTCYNFCAIVASYFGLWALRASLLCILRVITG